MKKIISCLTAVLMIAALFAGCSNAKPNVASQGEKIKIIATTFPQYDWVRQILGDNINNAELTLLLDSGVDLHSYQPTADDMIAISTCDMFIYVGGESDAWVEDAMKVAVNDNMIVINLLEVLGDAVKIEEIVEGMEDDHDHSHAQKIDPHNVGDRPLSYYAGNWVTIENALSSGAMDAYISAEAEENETDFDSQRANYAKRWQSAYPSFAITGDGLMINGVAISYQYVGYTLVEDGDSVTVWYGYEAADTMGIAPKYIGFNDHTAEAAEEDHGHEGESHGDEEGEALAHYHMRYGDESFEALVAIEGWAPTYFPSDASDEEVAGVMSGHSHGHEEDELDEHVWLSLKNAQTISKLLADRLGEIDPENAALYQANAVQYNSRLSALDREYQAAVKDAATRTLLFADRFPFRYLVDDYGLDYYSAFSGCSAETEASFETIVFLANKVNELKLKAIMVIETSDQSIAETVLQNTANKNQKILVLDSIQSVASSDLASGVTYLSIMESNLAVLKEALG